MFTLQCLQTNKITLRHSFALNAYLFKTWIKYRPLSFQLVVPNDSKKFYMLPVFLK